MPRFLFTYDLRETNPDPHYEFKQACIEDGWTDLIINANQTLWYELPNTTLRGDFASKADAVASFRKASKAASRKLGVNVTITKWIVAHYLSSSFDSDEKYRSE